jgi:NAD(P)-dependent dehydrogenase (short-subunit alcohol dehydrogenase family)
MRRLVRSKKEDASRNFLSGTGTLQQVRLAASSLYWATVLPAACSRRAWNRVKMGPGHTALTRIPSAPCYQGGAAYSMAKVGVHGFIRDVALELAEYNITVNAAAPGPIDTERTGPGLRRLDATVERSPSKMTPLGRLGTAYEVAGAALFLASDEASYISGHTLAVAGGR